MFRNKIWLTGTKVLKTKLFFFNPDIIHYLDKDSRNQNTELIFDFHRKLGGGGVSDKGKRRKGKWKRKWQLWPERESLRSETLSNWPKMGDSSPGPVDEYQETSKEEGEGRKG